MFRRVVLCSWLLAGPALAGQAPEELAPLPPPPVVEAPYLPPPPPPRRPPPPPVQSYGGGGRWSCPPLSLLHLLHAGVGGTLTGPREQSMTFVELRAGLLCVNNSRGNPKDLGFHLIPELGLHGMFENDEAGASATLGSIGVGIGGGLRWASVAFTPRLLAGSRGGELIVGARHTVTVRLLYEVLSGEIGHQVLLYNGVLRNDLVAMGSVNVLLLLYAFSGIR